MRLDGDLESILSFKLKELYPNIFSIVKVIVIMGIVFSIDRNVFIFY